ncbi:MAG: molybdopterin-dependent oxidoreductase [Candidatus Lustribacter sp.]|jgi:DMSO/TMAO reductase YedYZ molybdopterin-dependent catalytic subunit
MISRETFLAAAAATVTFPFANGNRAVASFPQKRPLIVLTTRPVQLETPFSVFDAGEVTPNDAFFVRWHLANVPTSVDPAAFELHVHGSVDRELRLSFDDLRTKFEPVELAAVLECAGNSRGFVTPRVPGGQWGNGAMGNARWKGARLRDILAQAGVLPSAVQVRFQGADRPVLPTTPTFVKALDVAVANDPTVIVAYEMNGTELPLLNGFPVRLIVPGYFGTYWVKMLNDIELLDAPEQSFWMKTAYRVPATPNNSVAPTDTGYATVPIGRLTVRSFITNLAPGATVRAGRVGVRGIAFDGGSGIRTVEFSADGGTSWTPALVRPPLGPYSFHRWETTFFAPPGAYRLASRATNNLGETQIERWNPSGYAHDAIETVAVTAQ